MWPKARTVLATEHPLRLPAERDSHGTRSRQGLRGMVCTMLSNLVVLLPGVYVFVVLKKDSGYTQETLAAELQELISKKIAKYAAPDYVQVTQANWSNTHTGRLAKPFPSVLTLLSPSQVTHRLPKTRSGKIMRRVLRKIVENKANELGDLTTLDDYEAVQQIIKGHKHLVERQKGN